MRITDLLNKNSIELGAEASSKEMVIDKLIELQCAAKALSDKGLFRSAITERESQSTTAIGDGVAIPHAKSRAVKKASLSAMTVADGVDYGAPDGKRSHLFFMIAAPEDGADTHLEVLSRLMTLLMDEGFRQRLMASKSREEFMAAIDSAERDKYPENGQEAVKEGGYRILAVTACPTGIAHTYMAAEALEKAGGKLGFPLKAETNGSGGVKNRLTDEEIAHADGIIIAADKTVDTERFDGKKVIFVKAADGINKAEELVLRIARGDVEIYRYSGERHSSSSSSNESVARRIYKHLMNGVSHMLPFVIGGGIFIAIAFLIDTIAGAPQDADFGVHTPVAAFFKTIGGYAFNFMIPILAGYIAMSIADRPGLLVGFVGGFLATTGSTFADVAGGIPSGFLGALFAGFVGGYLVLGLRKLCDYLPRALEGIKPVLIYPLVGLGLISVVMCAVNPVMGSINTALMDFLNAMHGTSKVILGIILGAMMAIDMGGPFNKAAYVFGTAAIASGNYDIMAAVMIGGMVPPLAIALATTFFKNRFTEDEIKNGPVNYIMGLAFITEGAIPYAAADPLRVIPSCMIGSAVAGGLSMFFGCTLMAPHGGIFVFAVVGNWLMYIIALAAGAVAGMLALGLLKRRVERMA